MGTHGRTSLFLIIQVLDRLRKLQAGWILGKIKLPKYRYVGNERTRIMGKIII